jgi:3-methyladenine DNA glycosylase AlkC
MARRLASSGLDPSVPANVILDALQSNNPPRQVIGREAKVIAAMVRLLPYRALYRLTRVRGR